MVDSISISICDDHTLVRAGLRKLIEVEPDLIVIAEAANADEAVEQVRASAVDVLLLDIVMPGRSGIDALPEIREAAPDTKIVVLSMQDDPVYVRQAFTAGARGYVLKEAAGAELVQAIRDVASGECYLHPLLGARIAKAAVVSEVRTDADPLSGREHNVMRLLALGHTNQEIAQALFISVRTTETHRARIMQKLGLKTRAEIVRHAIAAGELEVELPTRRAS
jgi:two-component system, NarL family, response regulator NreC